MIARLVKALDSGIFITNPEFGGSNPGPSECPRVLHRPLYQLYELLYFGRHLENRWTKIFSDEGNEFSDPKYMEKDTLHEKIDWLVASGSKHFGLLGPLGAVILKIWLGLGYPPVSTCFGALGIIWDRF